MKDIDSLRSKLLASPLEFTKFFYYLKENKRFETPSVPGRQSHYKIVFDALQELYELKHNRLRIHIPPGHGKSTMLVYFIAWAMAHYPDSNFIYISYSYDLAEKHTFTIKQIISLPEYRELFGVYVSRESSARGNFRTNFNGSVVAFGSTGSITGQDAGLPYVDRFSGMVVIDDAHKPDEVHSDTIRERVIQNYNQTIKPRPRSDLVPICFIGQRLHEADLCGYLESGKDGYEWKTVILKGIDDAGNALCPGVKSLEALRIEEKHNPYVFASQYQQNPIPAGGGIFSPDWFVIKHEEPEIIKTFLTCDTAETDKNYNDATVFSFWGIYEIENLGVKTGNFALHWIDCAELRIEPNDLESHFLSFYSRCMTHPKKPDFVGIEKKSTGVTLISVLKRFQGLRILDIHRTKASGNKASRFLEMQPWISKGHISINALAKHRNLVIEHMRKITLNDSHRFDDICDTCYDAIKMGIIDNLLRVGDNQESTETVKFLANNEKLAYYKRQQNKRGW